MELLVKQCLAIAFLFGIPLAMHANGEGRLGSHVDRVAHSLRHLPLVLGWVTVLAYYCGIAIAGWLALRLAIYWLSD